MEDSIKVCFYVVVERFRFFFSRINDRLYLIELGWHASHLSAWRENLTLSVQSTTNIYILLIYI